MTTKRTKATTCISRKTTDNTINKK